MPVADSSDPTGRALLPRITVVIPARYESSRFPGKPLARIGERPMIEHVYRRACASPLATEVIVATDDVRIARAVEDFGGDVRMTRSSHRSGTERLAEVAESLTCEIVVNVQGDEPLLEPAMIDEAVAPLLAERSIEMGTLRRRIEDPADLEDPNVVKVVVDRNGFALYFSRAAIPFQRDIRPGAYGFRHIGLYAYRRSFLIHLAALAETPLERAEMLEQLRALEHGYPVKVVETVFDSIGVDVPADLERVRKLLDARGGDPFVGRALDARAGRA